MRAFRAWKSLAWGLVLALGAVSSAAAADGTTKTKYPVLLVNGFGGVPFDSSLLDDLRSGGATVFTPFDLLPAGGLDAAHYAIAPSAVVAPVLKLIIQQYLAGPCQSVPGLSCDKVNIIGFSKGGLDTRALLSDPDAPSLLASVATVASPHKGGGALANKLLACILAAPPLSLPDQGCDPAALNAFFALQTFLVPRGLAQPPPGDPAGDAFLLAGLAQIAELDTSGLPNFGFPVFNNQTFNAVFPTGLPASACGNGAPLINGPSGFKIPLVSWTGNKVQTAAANADDAALTTLLAGTSAFIPDDDGLVERCKAHFGTVLIDQLPLNHFDQGGQIGGNQIASLFLRAYVAALKIAGR